MHMHHQSRNYSYNSQSAYSGHEQSQVTPDSSYSLSVHGYLNASYDHQQAAQYQRYYGTNSIAGRSNQVIQGDPYYRTMSPNAATGHHRYHNTVVDPRYLSSRGTASAPSLQVSDPGYPTQTGYYATRYHPRAHPPIQQTPSPQYIPSLSELRPIYPSYPHRLSHPQWVSPALPYRPTQSPPDPPSTTEPYTTPDCPPPHRIIPLSQPSPPASQAQELSIVSPDCLRASTPSNSQSSSASERFPCRTCNKTFTRAFDVKRHHETHHLQCPIIHRCYYCEKELSRADALKRHLNSCSYATP